MGFFKNEGYELGRPPLLHGRRARRRAVGRSKPARLQPGHGRAAHGGAGAGGRPTALHPPPDGLRADPRRERAVRKGAFHGGERPDDPRLAGRRRPALRRAHLRRQLDGKFLRRQFRQAVEARRPVPHRLQDDRGAARHRAPRGRDRHPQRPAGERQPRGAAHGRGRLRALSRPQPSHAGDARNG